MSRITTDEDVAFLVGRISRICAGILQAHSEGYGPSPTSGRLVSDVIADLLKTPVLDASRELGSDISGYYLAVYRYMIARGSPEGVEVDWLAVVDLFRSIGDAYADVNEIPGTPAETVDHPEQLRHELPGAEELRVIAQAVSAEIAAAAYAAVTAVLNSLARGTGTNPLSLGDRELLRLMISGKTVEEIAFELGVSSRTIHRRLQAVWDQVGADSRSEGIAIASARGWLD